MIENTSDDSLVCITLSNEGHRPSVDIIGTRSGTFYFNVDRFYSSNRPHLRTLSAMILRAIEIADYLDACTPEQLQAVVDTKQVQFPTQNEVQS